MDVGFVVAISMIVTRNSTKQRAFSCVARTLHTEESSDKQGPINRYASHFGSGNDFRFNIGSKLMSQEGLGASLLSFRDSVRQRARTEGVQGCD